MLAASGTQIQNTYLITSGLLPVSHVSRPVFYQSALYHVQFTTRHVLSLPVMPCVTSCIASTGRMMLAASGTQIQNTYLHHVQSALYHVRFTTRHVLYHILLLLGTSRITSGLLLGMPCITSWYYQSRSVSRPARLGG